MALLVASDAVYPVGKVEVMVEVNEVPVSLESKTMTKSEIGKVK